MSWVLLAASSDPLTAQQLPLHPCLPRYTTPEVSAPHQLLRQAVESRKHTQTQACTESWLGPPFPQPNPWCSHLQRSPHPFTPSNFAGPVLHPAQSSLLFTHIFPHPHPLWWVDHGHLPSTHALTPATAQAVLNGHRAQLTSKPTNQLPTCHWSFLPPYPSFCYSRSSSDQINPLFSPLVPPEICHNKSYGLPSCSLPASTVCPPALGSKLLQSEARPKGSPNGWWWWVSCLAWAGAFLEQPWEGHGRVVCSSGAFDLGFCLLSCPWTPWGLCDGLVALEWAWEQRGQGVIWSPPPDTVCWSVLLGGCADELCHIT